MGLRKSSKILGILPDAGTLGEKNVPPGIIWEGGFTLRSPRGQAAGWVGAVDLVLVVHSVPAAVVERVVRGQGAGVGRCWAEAPTASGRIRTSALQRASETVSGEPWGQAKSKTETCRLIYSLKMYVWSIPRRRKNTPPKQKKTNFGKKCSCPRIEPESNSQEIIRVRPVMKQFKIRLSTYKVNLANPEIHRNSRKQERHEVCVSSAQSESWLGSQQHTVAGRFGGTLRGKHFRAMLEGCQFPQPKPVFNHGQAVEGCVHFRRDNIKNIRSEIRNGEKKNKTEPSCILTWEAMGKPQTGRQVFGRCSRRGRRRRAP